MRYTKHSLSQNKKKSVTPSVNHLYGSEGIFETPDGKFIVQVKGNAHNKRITKTLCKRNTIEEAKAEFDKYKKQNPPQS